jgi:hypothetical protein
MNHGTVEPCQDEPGGMTMYFQKAAKQTPKAKKAWLAWLKTYTPEKFLDSFLYNVENVESECAQCREKIYCDVLIGGGVPDWCTLGGDFGCDESPETDEDGCGGHMPKKRPTK